MAIAVSRIHARMSEELLFEAEVLSRKRVKRLDSPTDLCFRQCIVGQGAPTVGEQLDQSLMVLIDAGVPGGERLAPFWARRPSLGTCGP
jgi:hypothetical protein